MPAVPRKPREQGWSFTLIELLVVIAIIAILASMLLPALGRARDMVRTVACSSNLHQMSISLVCYQDDSDGALPYHLYYTNPDGWPYILDWVDVMHRSGHVVGSRSATTQQRYTPSMLNCPEAMTLRSPEIKRRYASADHTAHTYSIHYLFSGHYQLSTQSWRNDGISVPRRLVKNGKPHLLALVTDSAYMCDPASPFLANGSVSSEMSPSYVGSVSTNAGWPGTVMVGWRHDGLPNVLWGDMHVTPALRRVSVAQWQANTRYNAPVNHNDLQITDTGIYWY